MTTFVLIVWWLLLVPSLCTFVVSAAWFRLLRIKNPRKPPHPPYASIAGFIFGGWYGFLAIGLIVMFSNLVPFLNFTNNPAITQKQMLGNIFCILTVILCAFAGEWLAIRIARCFEKPRYGHVRIHCAR